jgi:hypothetical protein
MQWLADLLVVWMSPAGLTATAAVAAGLLFPRLAGALFRPIERTLSQATRRAPLALCAIVALAIYAGAGLIRMPVPIIHDEFSNLVAADTFAHGRLANPPHPHWRHFENFHLLQQPTYASKFPPGTGAALAMGMLVGHPIAGMWLVMTACAAALAWALSARLPRPWAVLGSLAVITHALVFPWGESYWGGAVALLGSALFLGAVARGRAFVAAAGLAILMISRPYEGAALAVAVFAAALLFRRPIAWKKSLVAGACVLVPTAAFLAYDNARVTGHPLLLPYTLYERQYNPAPLFVWQEPLPMPRALPADMQREYANRLQRAERQRSVTGWMIAARDKALRIADDVATLSPDPIRWWPALMLLTLPLVLARRREARAALFAVGLTLAAIFCVTWYIPYYLAVLFPLFAFLGVSCLRQLRASRIGSRRAGLLWSRLLVCAWVAAFAVEMSKWKQVPSMWQGALDRARIQDGLERRPGRDLVLVEYGPNHFIHVSWTYNGADIDGAEVVWARSLTPRENDALIRHFRDRNVWLIRPEESLRLIPVGNYATSSARMTTRPLALSSMR